MTTPALLKRLGALAPPLRLTSRDAPAPDPCTLDCMRAYLAGRPVAPPGVTGNVLKAMRAFLAEQQIL